MLFTNLATIDYPTCLFDVHFLFGPKNEHPVNFLPPPTVRAPNDLTLNRLSSLCVKAFDLCVCVCVCVCQVVILKAVYREPTQWNRP